MYFAIFITKLNPLNFSPIPALLQGYLPQQSELNSMDSDLTALETEADQLEARVKGLESDLVSC